MQRSGGNVRLGLGRGGFHHQPPFGKIQAGPGELAAVQKGVLPGGELCLGHSRTGLQARFPQDGAGPRSLSGGEGRGVRIPDELLCKEQQRHKHRQPRPKPGPAQQGAQAEIQPQLPADAQPHPVLAGQRGKARVLPRGAPPAKPSRQGRYPVGMQPGPGGSGEQGLGAAAACSELHRGPKAYRFHGHLLVIRKVRAHEPPPQGQAAGGKGDDLQPVAVDGQPAMGHLQAQPVGAVGQDAAKVLHLHAAPAQVDGRGVVKALRRLTEQQGQPALQQKPLFALGTPPIPSHPAVLPAARCYIYMDAEG